MNVMRRFCKGAFIFGTDVDVYGCASSYSTSTLQREIQIRPVFLGKNSNENIRVASESHARHENLCGFRPKQKFDDEIKTTKTNISVAILQL